MIHATSTYAFRVLQRLSIGGIVALLLAAPVQAQPSALQEAKEASEFGEYEQAATLLSEVTQDTSVDETYRRDAFEYLVRAYIAQGQREKARTAMKTWLQMEPPPVKLDPNRQPPDLMRIYYEVRKEMTGEYAVRQDPGLQTLAIMDFTNASVNDAQRWLSVTEALVKSMMASVCNPGSCRTAYSPVISFRTS